jgi:hypothetical protein
MIQAPGGRAGPARLTDDGGAIAASPVAAACDIEADECQIRPGFQDLGRRRDEVERDRL